MGVLERDKREDLEKDLRQTLNIACAENASNTPDFVLASYLLGCLDTFNTAVQAREKWYGRTAPVHKSERLDDLVKGWTIVEGHLPEKEAQDFIVGQRYTIDIGKGPLLRGMRCVQNDPYQDGIRFVRLVPPGFEPAHG